MRYKSMLSVVTDAGNMSHLEAAIDLAQREDAHLDVLCLGIDRAETGFYYAGATAIIHQETIERARADAKAIEAAVRDRLDNEEMRWAVETGIAQVAALGGQVAMLSRFSDLVILPKPYGDKGSPEAEVIIESAMFQGRAPVLVVPKGCETATWGKRIVLAWNQSDEALVAARAALPFLSDASLVDITVIDPPAHGPERSDPGGMLSQLLARHGVKTEVSVLARTLPRISEVLSRHVRDVNADMVVMGAYGHSRFREAILGGATRNMLEFAEVPILMAH